jgi:cyclopropane fatty-acyl-phospholipid synthase-like methyltransferase
MRTAQEQNRDYFRRAYETGCHGWETVEPSPYVARNLALVAAQAPGRRLLDLGCGEGRHCILAARLGFFAVGVDYEPRALQRAQMFAREAAVHDAARFLAADLFSLPFRLRPFDVLVDYGCLHHQRKRDWPRYLAAVRGVLRPGGHFLLSVFSTAFRAYGRVSRPWHLSHGAYRRFFTPEDLRGLLAGDFDFLRLEEEREGTRGLWHALLGRRPT